MVGAQSCKAQSFDPIICFSMSSLNTRRKRTTGPMLGLVEKKEIVIDEGSNIEKWKAVKGFWDGSF